MIQSHFMKIWFCVFALLVMQITVSGKSIKKVQHERRVRELRQKREAPLIHAPDEKIDDEYIVKLKDGLTDEQLAQFEDRFQALAEEHGLHVDFQIDFTSLMKGFVARVPAEAVEILRKMEEVEFVEEDEVVHGDKTFT